ncbi:hypothetical protein F0562_005014 [Nyssa sinensis]|uniref:Uncharacterized protein n=1 Tax=Nyssa sinensis TaxID=561372 RepID=A0A5J5AGW9_9ASTE|nr:hypothetical protein F0562_005014 [Nyssa sinensis]
MISRFARQHYYCFAYRHYYEQWNMFDDETEKVSSSPPFSDTDSMGLTSLAHISRYPAISVILLKHQPTAQSDSDCPSLSEIDTGFCRFLLIWRNWKMNLIVNFGPSCPLCGHPCWHTSTIWLTKIRQRNQMLQKHLEKRKAEETLEYQRQIDNEAKLEQLGEQNKKGCGTIRAKLAERVPVLYFGREPVRLGKKVPVVYYGRIPVKVGETVPIVYSKPSNAGGPVTQSGVRNLNSWKSTDISCSHPNQYVELDDPDVSQRTRIRHTMIIRSEGQIHRPDKDAPPSPPPPADASGPSTAVGASTSSSQPRPSPSALPQQPWTIQTGFTGRQIENEAKREKFDEQNKKACGTIPAKAQTVPVIYFGTIAEKFGEAVPVVYSKPSDVGEPATRHSGDKYSDGWKSSSTDMQSEAVAPTSLRIGLSNLYPDRNFFQVIMHAEMNELLKLVEMNDQLACDPEAGGCEKFNFSGWQTSCESAKDISLTALTTEIDIGVPY